MKLVSIVLFVQRFDESLRFYEKALGLPLVGPGRKRKGWAEFRVNGIHLALHGEDEAPRLNKKVGVGPFALTFVVRDIKVAERQIRRYVGAITSRPREIDFRPTESLVALVMHVSDPDGNVCEIRQILRRTRARS